MGKRALQLSKVILISLLSIHVSQQQGFDPCEDVEEGDFVRGPINCSHFIVCDGDAPYDDFCKDGQLFNADTQQCDDPDNVQCSDNNEYYSDEQYYEDEFNYNEEEEESVEGDDDQNGNKDGDGGGPAEGDRDSNQNAEGNLKNGCPRNDDPSKVIFIPNSESCSEYFLCYHGVPISMQCTDNLYFNPHTNKCDFPRNVNCRLETTNTATSVPKCNRDVYMEVYPHPTQCDYYYYCRRGYLSIQQCPFYFYFDKLTKTCRIRDGTQC